MIMGKIRVVSDSAEPFADRQEAGRLLAGELKSLNGKRVVVLGILRGGIIVAREIALALGAKLDIVLSRKIGAPMNPEYALGAVSEAGELFLNKNIVSCADNDTAYIQQEKMRQVNEIKRRGQLFRRIHPKVSLENKTIIVTDDGVATGATMQAALWAVRHEHPKKIIAAIPVAPEESLKELAKDADEVICLKAPFFFSAVGQFYLQFEQITDEEVFKTLKKIHEVPDVDSGENQKSD